MRSLLCITLLSALISPAQDQPEKKASITGTVQDAVGGAPVEGVNVHANSAEATTDAKGRFQLNNLAPGTYRMQGYSAHGSPSNTKVVNVAAGQDLTSVALTMPSRAAIRGRVLDENKEPVPGVSVFLIASGYSLGQLRRTFVKEEDTNDKGEYNFGNVVPHGGYLIMAEKRVWHLDAISDSPIDPKLRKKAVAATFYPGSSTIEGAQPFTAHEGEHLEGVDIRMQKTESYCIEATLMGANASRPLGFSIEQAAATSGYFGDGGLFMATQGGSSGPEGHIRICNLAPGEYKVSSFDWPSDHSSATPTFSTLIVSVVDRDIKALRVPGTSTVRVTGHILWYDKPPDPTVEAKVSLAMQPMTRAYFPSEIAALQRQLTVPSDFSIPGVFADDYAVHIHGLSGNLYVQDITYAGFSILNAPLSIGKTMGNPDLRIVIAHDGGHIRATIADKDGKAVPDSFVTIIPASASSGASLEAALVSGQADQNGVFLSDALPPGKYYLLATDIPADPTPDTLDKFWLARSKAQEVEVTANGTSNATLLQLNLE